MRRFYFDVNNGKSRALDDSGQDLPDFEAARRCAVEEIVLIMRDELPDGDRECYVVTIRDGDGTPVGVATASLLFERFDGG